MKKTLIVILLLVLSLSLMACSHPGSTGFTSEDDAFENGEQWEPSDDGFEEEGGEEGYFEETNRMTLAEAVDSGGIFALDANGMASSNPSYMELKGELYAVDSGHLYRYGSTIDSVQTEELDEKVYAFVNCDDQGNPPYMKIDRSNGDKLISIGSDAEHCKLYSVDLDGYWPGYELSVWCDGDTHEWPMYGLAVNGETADIAEVNGVDVTNSDGNAVLAALNDNGVNYAFASVASGGWDSHSLDLDILFSDHPSEYFELGYYCGSDFDSGRVYLDSQFFFGHQVEAEINRTKEGYFEVDLSNIAPGRYFASMGFQDDRTWIAFEIV